MKVTNMAESDMNNELSVQPEDISRRKFMEYAALYGVGTYVLLNGINLFNPNKSIAAELSRTEESIDDILQKENYNIALTIGVRANEKKNTKNIETRLEKGLYHFNIGATSFSEKGGIKTPYNIMMDYNTLVDSGINFTEEQKRKILSYVADNKPTEKITSKECKYWPIALTKEQGKIFLIAGGYLMVNSDGELMNNSKKPLHFRSGKDRPNATDLFTSESGYEPRQIRCTDKTKEKSYFPGAFSIQPYAKNR
jgi:hypothetical protein